MVDQRAAEPNYKRTWRIGHHPDKLVQAHGDQQGSETR